MYSLIRQVTKISIESARVLKPPLAALPDVHRRIALDDGRGPDLAQRRTAQGVDRVHDEHVVVVRAAERSIALGPLELDLAGAAVVIV